MGSLYLLPKYWRQAGEMALKIKQAIRREVGEWITGSIGIAENKMLAKLASEHQKPNGLTIVPSDTVSNFLKIKNLTDICGIGAKISQQLAALNIRSIEDLGRASEIRLKKQFGLYGIKLKNWGQGNGSAQVRLFGAPEAIKSVSHSQTLGRDTGDVNEVLGLALRLCNKAARRLRV